MHRDKARLLPVHFKKRGAKLAPLALLGLRDFTGPREVLEPSNTVLGWCTMNINILS